MSSPALELKNINKAFIQGEETHLIISDVSLKLEVGEIIALIGPSGSGKSTFLQIAGLMDKPDSGEIFINGLRTDNLSEIEKAQIRRDYIGYVYQFHHLLSDFTAIENVAMPLLINNFEKNKINDLAIEILTEVGLSHRLNHRPAQLSGGEQQRVAIARALIKKPKILFADEPTGNLDPQTAAQIFDLFIRSIRRNNTSALIVTHNHELANLADKVVNL